MMPTIRLPDVEGDIREHQLIGICVDRSTAAGLIVCLLETEAAATGSAYCVRLRIWRPSGELVHAQFPDSEVAQSLTASV
jgi:hypothetical protein